MKPWILILALNFVLTPLTHASEFDGQALEASTGDEGNQAMDQRQEPDFFYHQGYQKCMNREGTRPGLNPNYLGECGNITRGIFRNKYFQPGKSFAGAVMVQADLSNLKSEESNFTGANLMQANLSGANLRGSRFAGVNLSYVNLSRANLIGANLEGANLRNADLGGADLSDADLASAHLECADLSSAKLDRANLQGAKYNLDTKFPESLQDQKDRNARGMIAYYTDHSCAPIPSQRESR